MVEDKILRYAGYRASLQCVSLPPLAFPAPLSAKIDPYPFNSYAFVIPY